MPKTISILVPVLDEEKYIDKCLSSLNELRFPEDWRIIEILVLDGGSRDQTRAIVACASQRDPRVKLLENPGRIQSAGLNLAIKAAAGDFIVRLDAHAIYPQDYLENCILTWSGTDADNVGGIVLTMPGGDSYGAQLVQALTTHRFGVGGSGFRTGGFAGKVDTVPFGFFKRDIFAKAGLFDERLVRAQDYEMNKRISAAGGTIWLDSRIKTSYFNQATLTGFLKKQIFREAPYNAYMWYLAPYAFAWRHSITGFFSFGVLSGLFLWPWYPPRLIYAAVLSVYAVIAIASSLQQSVRYRQLRHLFVLPFAFFGYHFIHGLGVLAGVFNLLTHNAPVQKIKEPWPGAGQFSAWPPPDGKSWSSGCCHLDPGSARIYDNRERPERMV